MTLNDGAVDDRVSAFQAEVATDQSDMMIVRRSVLHGPAYAIDIDESFVLASSIADYWHVHPNRDVYIVGSAKLGFSISPVKRWRRFGDESDIDVAVVSETLFEKFWNEIDQYAARPDSWDNRKRCLMSIGSGWIRPDLLPGSMATEWFEFFRVLQREKRFSGGIKLAAGIYHSMGFLERYQARAVSQCRKDQYGTRQHCCDESTHR